MLSPNMLIANNYTFNGVNTFNKFNHLKNVLLHIPTKSNLIKLYKKQIKIRKLTKTLNKANILNFFTKYVRKSLKYFIPNKNNYFREVLLKALHAYTGYTKIFITFKPIQFIPEFEEIYYFYNQYNNYYLQNFEKVQSSYLSTCVSKYLGHRSPNFVTDRQVKKQWVSMQKAGKIKTKTKFDDLPSAVIASINKRYKKRMFYTLFKQGVNNMLVQTKAILTPPTYLEVFGDIRYIQPIQPYLEKLYSFLLIKEQNVKNSFTALKNLFHYLYTFQKAHFWRAFKMYHKIIFKLYKLKVLPLIGIKAIFKGRFGKVRKQIAKFQLGYLRLNSVESSIVYYNTFIRTQRGSYGYHLWFAYDLERKDK